MNGVIARTTELVNEVKKFESLQLPPDLKRKFLLMKLSLRLPAPNDPKAPRRADAGGRIARRQLRPGQVLPRQR